MVYCTKCGTLNPDTAINCSNCGAPLFATESRPYSRYERRRYYRENYGYSRGSGGGIGLPIIGLFIILIGLAAFAGFTAFWNYFWPIVLVLVGVWILVLGLRHNRRHNSTSPS
ncbi:MAG TPA: zinc ribbon domain-containing protein [Candidatus Bathyarchaeia archaeon]